MSRLERIALALAYGGLVAVLFALVGALTGGTNADPLVVGTAAGYGYWAGSAG